MPADTSHRFRRLRLFKAYFVTARVLLSYAGFRGAALVRGPDWAAARRAAHHRRNARRVVDLILDLNGLFIKVGQLISILTNFLPEDFRRELEALQDQLPPRPLAEVERRIRHEFGQPTGALFATFEATPLASASLAQVHAATLADGRRVAVKVQHPDIEETARMDLRTIRRLLAVVGTIIRIRGLYDQYLELEAMIRAELDFAQEARHLEAIAAHFRDDPEVGFPDVVPERSTRRVLTTTFVDGIKVTDLDALDAAGIDREALAARIVRAYCQMIFVDGLYHADPHPGNLLVRPDGQVVFLDFGAVAALSPEMKAGAAEFVMGLLHRDAERITAALRRAGFIARDGHADTVDALIDYVHEHLLADLSLEAFRLQDLNLSAAMEAKMALLMDMHRLGASFRELTATFRVPKDVALLARTLVLLMGLCTHLAPSLNPVAVVRPYLEAFVLGPERNWKRLLGGVIRETALAAVTLPGEVRRLLAQARRGEVRVRVHGLPEHSRRLYALGHQLLYGLLGLGAGVLAYQAHLHGDLLLARGLAAGCGFFFLCLGGSLLRARRG